MAHTTTTRRIAGERPRTDHRRSRHCPTCGHLGGGLIRDRPEWAFLEAVESILDCIELPHSFREALLQDARSRKQRGVSDVPNLQSVLHDLQHGRDSA